MMFSILKNKSDKFLSVSSSGEGSTRILLQSYPPRALDRRLQEDWARDAREGPRVLMSLRVDFGLSMSPLIIVHIRLRFHYFWTLYLGLHNVGRIPLKCRIFQPLYFRAPRQVFVLGVIL